MKNNIRNTGYKNCPAYVVSFILFVCSIAIPGLVQAADATEEITSQETLVESIENHSTIAIQGYDPVAYFTLLKSVKGSENFSHEWLGDKWLFANEEHKAMFIADSMHYMPNYGGYCSFDPVSRGHEHEVDPAVWNIVNDKLYLYYSEEIAGQILNVHDWAQVKAGLPQ